MEQELIDSGTLRTAEGVKRLGAILQRCCDSQMSTIAGDRRALIGIRQVEEILCMENISYDLAEVAPLVLPPLVSLVAKSSNQLNLLQIYRVLELFLSAADVRELLMDLNFDAVMTRRRKQIVSAAELESIESLTSKLKSSSAVLETSARKFSFQTAEDNLISVSLHTGAESRMGTGWKIWEGALVLARYLFAHSHLIQDKRVLEIGAGCGLPGLAISKSSTATSLGPQSVLLTDVKSPTIDLLRRNIQLNQCASIADAVLFDWTRRPLETAQLKGSPYDLIIASEILYDPEASALLPAVLRQLISRDSERSPQILILSMSETYRGGLAPFLSAAKDQGDFRVTVGAVERSLVSDFSESIDWVIISIELKITTED